MHVSKNFLKILADDWLDTTSALPLPSLSTGVFTAFLHVFALVEAERIRFRQKMSSRKKEQVMQCRNEKTTKNSSSKNKLPLPKLLLCLVSFLD